MQKCPDSDAEKPVLCVIIGLVTVKKPEGKFYFNN